MRLASGASENPRVGGSIPPLATIQINISDQEVASERMGPLSNIYWTVSKRCLRCRLRSDEMRPTVAHCGHWPSRFDRHLADVRASSGIRLDHYNQGESHAKNSALCPR